MQSVDPISAALPPAERNKVRVLVADDHDIVRVGLRALLSSHPEIEVVGEARTGQETLSLATTVRPDVVLLDLRMPDLDGLEVCCRLKAGKVQPAVLFLTSYADDQMVLSAFEAGADGYLLKSFAGQNIPASILAVSRGDSALDPSVVRLVLSSLKQNGLTKQPRQNLVPLDLLTPQESRVMEQLVLGKSNKQIAQELRLSEGTVRNYLSTVFAKLQVEGRVEAALFWIKCRR